MRTANLKEDRSALKAESEEGERPRGLDGSLVSLTLLLNGIIREPNGKGGAGARLASDVNAPIE